MDYTTQKLLTWQIDGGHVAGSGQSHPSVFSGHFPELYELLEFKGCRKVESDMVLAILKFKVHGQNSISTRNRTRKE